MHHLLVLLSSTCFTSLADAVLLPSISAEAHAALGHTPVIADWWAQVGERVFYTPPTSFLGLSQNVSDYYFVAGSKSALTPAMNEHLVGSQGRWHIMHLPEGPSMLQVSARSYSGDRRSAISAFTQLKSGTVLSSGFPAYPLNTTYANPLDKDGRASEMAAVASITNDTAYDYLQELVQFSSTRSYSNPSASSKVEDFLKNKLKDLGLTTCYHTFKDGGNELTNIVAHSPVTGSDGAVIVGAHYDSRPFNGAAPGAEDNGSGVAALLAMAKTFIQARKDGFQPKKSVIFVAFAGEEPGLIGSRHFADGLMASSIPSDLTECTAKWQAQPSFTQFARSTQKHDSIVDMHGQTSFMQIARSMQKRDGPSTAEATAKKYAAIIMDEIGWKTPNPAFPKPTVNLESTEAQGEMMDHLRHSSKDHNGDKMDVVHNGLPFGSDHMSFLNNGISSVLTINGDDEKYPNYHQHTDTIDNVNADLMMMITKMNFGALMRMSGA